MRLPRRVPWARLSELDEVCSWIYADENDLDAKVRAINRMAAWRHITTIPHALESALSILCVIVQDASAQGSSSFLSLRQAYASAIVRLVNGLVDPLQLGAYARSIASIAAQLGLPAWLVELRHAATHEDLPSLEVLREAARDAMTWLLHNYFIPALNPSTSETTTKKPELRPPTPLLTEYKNLQKATTRDASLRTKYKSGLLKVLRDIERWISEAKLAANVTAATLEWDDVQSEEDDENVDGRERWALHKLCDHLLMKGGLIPVSKKKRSVSNSFEPSQGLIAVWTSLITHLATLHPSFPSLLVSRLVAALLATSETGNAVAEAETISLAAEGSSENFSYQMCAASWAHWLLNSFQDPNHPDEDEMDNRRLNTVATLVTSLGLTARRDSNDDKAAQHLLKVLTANRADLQETANLLLLQPPSSSSSWQEADLNTMSERLDALIALTDARDPGTAKDDAEAQSTSEMQTDEQEHLPPGWRRLNAREWKPTPIGVHYAARTN